MSCRHNRRNGRASCTRHCRFRKYASLCEDGAMSNQRSQQIKTYHHVHLRVALRWLWSNSVWHLMLVQISLQIADTYATVMIAEYMDLLVLLLLSTLPSNCHDVYIVPGRTNTSNIQICQEDTGPCLCHNILFAHACGAV